MIIKLRFLSLILFAATAAPLYAQTAPLLPADKILVSNPRTTVTYAEFEAELARIPVRDQYEFRLDRQRIAQMVENILTNKTLAIEARENNLDKDVKVQAEIRVQTDRVLAKYRGEQVQKNAPKIDLTGRARANYLVNPEKFTTPPLYDVWHVLIKRKGRTVAQAQALAEEIRNKLLAGESAEKLASTLSDDESASKNKGNLGLGELKYYDVRFAAAVEKLKVGEVSHVFESEFGYHVAKLRDFRAAKKYSFEEVKVILLEEAETQYLESVWNTHLERIRTDPKIYVDKDAMEALRPKLPPIPPLVPAMTEPKK